MFKAVAYQLFHTVPQQNISVVSDRLLCEIDIGCPYFSLRYNIIIKVF